MNMDFLQEISQVIGLASMGILILGSAQTVVLFLGNELSRLSQ